ncbi:MAG: dTMP kinase [Dokdonella sp.]
MKGRLITLEGGEGAGKSTVLAAVQARLCEHAIDVQITREPGGTAIGEAVRALVLDKSMSDVCAESELLLMFAARAQLVRRVIEPALAAGRWVLSDRYVDASYAYQGGGRGQPLERITSLDRWVTAGVRPDLTLLLDLPVEQGLSRSAERGAADRIESEQTEFFERVRASYRERAATEPQRFVIIDASSDIETVRAAAIAAIDRFVACAKRDETGRGSV